jgi:hypothetical protein
LTLLIDMKICKDTSDLVEMLQEIPGTLHEDRSTFLLYCCICCTVGIDVFPLDAGLLARGQYSEDPATGHLDTGYSCFPCV